MEFIFEVVKYAIFGVGIFLIVAVFIDAFWSDNN